MKVFVCHSLERRWRGGIYVLSLTRSCTSILKLDEDVRPQLPQKNRSILGILEEEKKKKDLKEPRYLALKISYSAGQH